MNVKVEIGKKKIMVKYKWDKEKGADMERWDNHLMRL
jgi:hypothetical protein